MRSKIISIIIVITVVICVFTPFFSRTAYSLSKQEILNSAVLTPMKTGYTPTDELIEKFFKKNFTEGMTTFDKVKLCYDESIYNTTYGKSFDSRQVAVVQREYGFIAERDAYIALRAYTFLTGRIGVCNDYSCAFVALTRAIGLKSYIVTGQTNTTSGGYAGHMWVNVLIDGTYYTFDPQVECNIMLRRADKKIQYTRFCVTDEDMKGRLILYDRQYDISLFNDFKKINEDITYATILPTKTAVTTAAVPETLSVTADRQGKMRLGKEITFTVSGPDPDSVIARIVKKEDGTSAASGTDQTTSYTAAETNGGTVPTESEQTESSAVTATDICAPTTAQTVTASIAKTTATEPDQTASGALESTSATETGDNADPSEADILLTLNPENGIVKWTPDTVGAFTVLFFDGYGSEEKEPFASFEFVFYPEYQIINDGDYVTGIPEKMRVSDVITAEGACFKDPFGCELAQSAFIGTGFRYVTGEKEFTVYVKGDTDGDGTLTATDYILIKRSMLGIFGLENEYFKAADTDSDGKLTATDYILVKRQILGVGDMYI